MIDQAFLTALAEQENNGHAYIPLDELSRIFPGSNENALQFCVENLREAGLIRIEGDKLYRLPTWRYEEYLATQLSELRRTLYLPTPYLPPELNEDGFTLSSEQCRAVELALSRRVAVILGGAGSGKTSVIRAIAARTKRPVRLCAPTGKAARNLSARTGLPAHTVHRLLGVCDNDKFLETSACGNAGITIVDEASMLSMGMLAGLLKALPPQGSLILLGDPNQLLSVGAGNVLADLETLGFPCVRLTQNYRQAEAMNALYHNVVNFDRVRFYPDLLQDDSFRIFTSASEANFRNALVREAVRRIRNGESVQVLAYSKEDVLDLNRRIQDRIHPHIPGRAELQTDDVCFREGDLVLITRNDRARNVCNGDVGRLHIVQTVPPSVKVSFPDIRMVQWDGAAVQSGLKDMSLAYAITVHKSQGCEYDTVLMLCHGYLHRNLIYTAISRARKNVILYGNRGQIANALRALPPERRSQLVEKVRMHSMRAA